MNTLKKNLKVIFYGGILLAISFSWNKFICYFYGALKDISLNGNLFLDCLAITSVLCLGLQIDKECSSDNKIGKVLGASFKFISIVFYTIVLFGVFRPSVLAERNITKEFLFSFLLCGMIRIIYAIIYKKFKNARIVAFNKVVPFLAMFSIILLLPAAFQTNKNSYICDQYAYTFDNKETYLQYKKAVTKGDGLRLIERMDNVTLVLQDITTGSVRVSRFKDKKTCNKYIEDNTVTIEEYIPIVPNQGFDNETNTIIYSGEVDYTVINEEKKQALNKMLPIASSITLATFIIYLVFSLMMLKRKRRLPDE